MLSFFFFVIRHSFTIEDLVSAPNLKLGCAVILRGCASDFLNFMLAVSYYSSTILHGCPLLRRLESQILRLSLRVRGRAAAEARAEAERLNLWRLSGFHFKFKPQQTTKQSHSLQVYVVRKKNLILPCISIFV